MDWINFDFSQMLDKIHSFLDQFFNQVKDLADWFIAQVIYLLGKMLYTIYSIFLLLVESIVNGISFVGSTAIDFAQWANLPPEVIWMMHQIGLPQCLSMIAAAIMIRVTLNLIPGVLTRI